MHDEPATASSRPTLVPGCRGVTWRAVIVGAILTAALTAGEPFGVLVVHGSALCADFSTGGAIFYLFLIVSFLNPFLRALRREWALS